MGVYTQRTVVASAATSGAQGWIPFDTYQTPFGVSFGVRKIGTGDITYRVEHTFDNVIADASAINILTHTDVSAATVSRDGNYAFPVKAARLWTAAASGQVALQYTFIQGDES